jgi:hypothetical protein
LVGNLARIKDNLVRIIKDDALDIDPKESLVSHRTNVYYQASHCGKPLIFLTRYELIARLFASLQVQQIVSFWWVKELTDWIARPLLGLTY